MTVLHKSALEGPRMFRAIQVQIMKERVSGMNASQKLLVNVK